MMGIVAYFRQDYRAVAYPELIYIAYRTFWSLRTSSHHCAYQRVCCGERSAPQDPKH